MAEVLTSNNEANNKHIVKKLRKIILVLNTGGPRYSRSFYLRIRLFTLRKMVRTDNFTDKNGLFFCEFKFAVKNDETYLPRITRETCIGKCLQLLQKLQ